MRAAGVLGGLSPCLATRIILSSGFLHLLLPTFLSTLSLCLLMGGTSGFLSSLLTPPFSLYFPHKLEKCLGRQVSFSPRKSEVWRKEEGGKLVGLRGREEQTNHSFMQREAQEGGGVVSRLGDSKRH